jgi:hypothetical protein
MSFVGFHFNDLVVSDRFTEALADARRSLAKSRTASSEGTSVL